MTNHHESHIQPYSESRGRIPAATQGPAATQTRAATQSPAATQGPAATQTGAATQSPAATQRPSRRRLESHRHLEVPPSIRVPLLGASPLPRTPPPLRVPSPSPSPFPLKVPLPPPKAKQPKISAPTLPTMSKDAQPHRVTDPRRIEGPPSQHIIPEQFLPPGIPQGTHLPTLAQPILYAPRVSLPLSETLTQPLRVPPPPPPVPLKVRLTSAQGEAAEIILRKSRMNWKKKAVSIATYSSKPSTNKRKHRPVER
ncbi:hypothetical protein BDZ91DRAFT_795251 [Kalaharituber pfeilii]|nr:hypothetical protein BDZ91DRAFT_795251 [Kalaharituber pfeilii]